MPRTPTPPIPKSPTTFLHLPRELRDKIYTYALSTPTPIDIGSILPSPGYWHDPVSHPPKPPTPSLLLANRQIHTEAASILYGTNTFKFPHPGQLPAFERQIGTGNCERVKSVEIWVRYPGPDEVVFDAGEMGLSEYDSVPEHWIAVLGESGMTGVRRLAVEAVMVGCEPDKVLSVLPMPNELRDCLVEFLGRGGDGGGGGVPRLRLKGISEEGRVKFPEEWDVVMSQWN